MRQSPPLGWCSGRCPEVIPFDICCARYFQCAEETQQTKSNIPVFDPATPVDTDFSSEDDHDEHAFDHPSSHIDQRWIWLPCDQLGLSELLANDLKAASVDVGASMDEKGIVEVTRNPPNEG